MSTNKFNGSTYSTMFDMFHAWQEQAARLVWGKITKEEYDQWRYNYPALATSGHWHKASPSKELSDYLVEAFKDKLKPDK